MARAIEQGILDLSDAPGYRFFIAHTFLSLYYITIGSEAAGGLVARRCCNAIVRGTLLGPVRGHAPLAAKT